MILKHRAFALLFLSLSFLHTPLLFAETEWSSFTLDNDIFVGNDSGYTNGFFYSWYNTSVYGDQPKPGLLMKPLSWTIPDQNADAVVSAYTIGQAMITPKDITIETPGNNDLPYSGLLFINNTFLYISKNSADKLSTTLGIVGSLSGAKASQKWMHEFLGSDDPKGWNSQLKDELVFKFTRARIWRSWVSEKDNIDFLFSSEAAIGTLESSIATGVMLRIGKDLIHSFATPLLSSSKTSNPIATEGGWYFYTGITARYILNQIFTDGNTFRDSPSIDFEKNQLGIAAGIAYSWQNISITLAVNDTNLNEEELAEQLHGLTRFGTLTLAWRH